ncbi:hypothetical protein GJV11_05000 [Enterobacteriaceae bacterium RIT693]|nr:hypothetical protein [Enterobacteriaceae bacterium RIT693]
MSKPTYEELEAKVQQLASENAYLLPKAASELSNAWVLHKYWVGIQVALMHVHEGRMHDGMVWLQNTVAGPGIEVPQLSEFAEIEAWAVEQQKDSISAVRALEIIKAETPATDAALAEMRNEARAEGLDGFIAFIKQRAREFPQSVLADYLDVITNNAEQYAYSQQLRKEQGK